MHRFYFYIGSKHTWYEIIADCNKQFGKDWRTKKKMLKAISTFEVTYRHNADRPPIAWFEVPSEAFGTFVMLKYNLLPASEKR
jgi:hypothetical protein